MTKRTKTTTLAALPSEAPPIDWKRADKWASEYEDDWTPDSFPNAARAYLHLKAVILRANAGRFDGSVIGTAASLIADKPAPPQGAEPSQCSPDCERNRWTGQDRHVFGCPNDLSPSAFAPDQPEGSEANPVHGMNPPIKPNTDSRQYNIEPKGSEPVTVVTYDPNCGACKMAALTGKKPQHIHFSDSLTPERPKVELPSLLKEPKGSEAGIDFALAEAAAISIKQAGSYGPKTDRLARAYLSLAATLRQSEAEITRLEDLLVQECDEDTEYDCTAYCVGPRISHDEARAIRARRKESEAKR